MLSKTIVVALAGTGAALGVWRATETLPRVVLSGLLIWLLFETIEAAQAWDRHPWKSYALTLWSFLRNRALAALVVPAAFLLTGIGVALIYTVVGSKDRNDIWMLVGLFVILMAIVAVMLVVPPYRQKVGIHDSPRRGSIHE